jgi:phosphate starvation-inducible protein PhoH
MFAGDATQTDLQKVAERTGILDFMQILEGMPEMSKIEFNIEDIVRSGLVRSYLVSKINQGYNEKI